MNKFLSRRVLKYILGIFVICGVISYQNCASHGNGGTPFNITFGSTSPGPLTISNISLASPSIQSGATYTAAVTLTGANLNGVSCSWALNDSGGSQVGTPAVTTANASNVCVASLIAPNAVGQFR